MVPDDQSHDWGEVRARMKRVIAAKVKGSPCSHEIDDLTQIACVRLIRAIERGGIQSPEAIQVVIAKRVAIDCLRRKPPPTEPLDDHEVPDRGLEVEGPSPEEVEVYFRETLRLIKSPCRELYDHWLRTLNLRKVAELLGISHAAALQRWVRCRRHILGIARADDGPLGRWVREGGEFA